MWVADTNATYLQPRSIDTSQSPSRLSLNKAPPSINLGKRCAQSSPQVFSLNFLFCLAKTFAIVISYDSLRGRPTDQGNSACSAMFLRGQNSVRRSVPDQAVNGSLSQGFSWHLKCPDGAIANSLMDWRTPAIELFWGKTIEE